MNDDIITLGDTQFPISGLVTVSAASDFEDGLKVGKVSYDQRENAFFLVFDDFTGGFGSQYQDIREELGTYWFAGSHNAPATMHAGRVSLPLSQEYVAITAPPTGFSGDVDLNHPWVERESHYVFALGNYIYTLNALGGTPQHRDTTSGTAVVAIVAAVDSVLGNDRLYAADNGTSDLYFSLDDGLTWANTLSKYLEHDLPPVLQGQPGDILKQDTVIQYTGAQQAYVFTNPAVTVFDPTGASYSQNQPDTVVEIPFITTRIWSYDTITPRDEYYENGEYTAQDGSDVLGAFTTDADGDVQGGYLLQVFQGYYGTEYLLAYDAPTRFITDNIDVHDVFFWDYKILGLWEGNKISFLVPASGDGLVYYTLPPGDYVESTASDQIGSVVYKYKINVQDNPALTLYDPAGASYSQAQPDTYRITPVHWPLLGETVRSIHHVPVGRGEEHYLVEGEEPWNHFLENDEHIVAAADIDRQLRFVGVMAAPWGEPAVYLRGGNKMYILDFFSRKLFPIEVGSDKPLIASVMHGGIAILTDGWNLYEFNPQSMTERDISFPSKWGIPPNLQGEDGPYQISGLISYDKELIAITVDPDGPNTVLYLHNGVGWHQLGARMDNFFANYGFRATFPLAGAIFTNRAQALIIPGANAITGATSFGYWQINLPVISHQPTSGLDTFGPSGARMYTGWVDGGFFDIDGTLLRLNCDAFFHNDDEKVIVEYRIDNDPTPEESATWTQMVDVTGVGSAFSNASNALYFANTDTSPRAGVKFRTVQFRLTFTRGSDATNSPELRAMTLVYLKTPELRTQWAFTVDINRMIENKTGNVETFYVDGAVATLENVWAKFRELWTNEHTLIPFTIPSALGADETFYVKLAAIPMSFDDFRTSVAGRGNIQVQVIEPVN